MSSGEQHSAVLHLERKPAGAHPKVSLGADFFTKISRRLEFLSAGAVLVVSGIFLFNVLIFDVVDLTPPPALALGRATQIAFVVLSLAMYAVSRSSLTDARKADVGLLYQVLAAVCLSFASYAGDYVVQKQMFAVSWVGVWILVYPAVAPAGFSKNFLAGLCCALVAPLVYFGWLTEADAAPLPAGIALTTFLPNFVCAVVAMLPVVVILRLGTDAHVAEEELSELGSYHLVERLGKGSMGEVWKAQHTLLKRRAAIKVLRRDAFGDDGGADALARFEREARLTATLESPHTIRLYDFGKSAEGPMYYVMELLHGLDLDALAARYGEVSPARTIYILRQACDSLAEAHGVGMVHRDIKPANLYLCRMGRLYDFVKVLDFGLVQARPEDSGALSTKAGKVVGTPAFMAPEQVTGGVELDGRADIYALGCVGYWLLTGGHLPFERETAVQTMLAQVSSPPIAPSVMASQMIPAKLDAIILSCLAKDPADRPPTAVRLAERLADVETEPWGRAEARAWWKEHLDA